MEVNFVDKYEFITDGLAQQGYAICDDFLWPELSNDLLQTLINKRELFKKAGIGKQNNFQLNAEVRGDYISWIEKDSADKSEVIYLQSIEGLMQYVNRSLYLGLKDYELHYAYYPEKTFYKRHSDRFNKTSSRILSLVFYLNENWKAEDGGELMLYPEGKPSVKIEPIYGRLACFLSDIEHEVLLCHRDRHSITGWILNQEKELNFLA